jgi:hypothetical protein
MGIVVDETPTPTPQSDITLTSGADWRTDRVNVMGYGPPGCGKTDFAVRFPKPVLIDSENGGLTVKKMLSEGRLKADVPIVKTTVFNRVMEIVTDPVYALAEIFRGSKWEGYEKSMETLIVDTFTTLEGWCMDEILEKTGKSDPDFPETNKLRRRMTAFFRKVWDLEYNTVLLGHDQPGRAETKDPKTGRILMRKKDPGPLLTGQLAKQGPALTDIFLYLRREPKYGEPDTFMAYTSEHPEGYPARIRIDLPDTIENPTYEILRDALNKLESKQENIKQ